MNYLDHPGPLRMAHVSLGLDMGGLEKLLVEFARHNQVTQIFVAHSQVGLMEQLRGMNFTEDIVRLAQDLQVTVVADRSRRQVS